MSKRATHTVATLEVSPSTHAEITGLLRAAKYDHAFDGTMIDMTGIGLIPGTEPESNLLAPEDIYNFRAKGDSKWTKCSKAAYLHAHARPKAFETRIVNATAPAIDDAAEIIAALQKALAYWMPQVFDDRSAHDAYLLMGYQGDNEPSYWDGKAAPASGETIDIVFDGPPGPDAGRFIEVENSQRTSISYGEWVHRRDDGNWVLRVSTPPQPIAGSKRPIEDDSKVVALNEMLGDAREELAEIRAAIGVPYEPHQSLHERTLDAARAGRIPGAQWREKGEADPHGSDYNCERGALTLGKLTDDELANGAFMNYDRPLDIERVIRRDPGYHSPIVWMTAGERTYPLAIAGAGSNAREKVSERSEELDSFFAGSDTPRVDNVIKATMKRFPGVGTSSQARYYEEVHQLLGPLARDLEREVAEKQAEIDRLTTQISAGWRNGAVVGRNIEDKA